MIRNCDLLNPNWTKVSDVFIVWCHLIWWNLAVTSEWWTSTHTRHHKNLHQWLRIRRSSTTTRGRWEGERHHAL